MALDPLLQTLANSVQTATPFDGRFRDATLVNYDPVADRFRGCFSIVFRATDEITGQLVALKFFNPHGLGNVYRLNAFHREHEILKGLVGIEKCLQLASNLVSFQLEVSSPAGSFTLPCEYFALEWVEDDVDGYSLCQDAHTPLEKLSLLCDIVSSVQALHARGVFHRDLKIDNLRAMYRGGKRIVIPIDFGTAARCSSVPIQSEYVRPAGAPAYSAPEATCGLAGNRLLAPFTDVYSIGCMLFELFNKHYFYDANIAVNGRARVHLAAMSAHLDLKADEPAQRALWNKAMKVMGPAFNPVRIDGPGSDVPPGIAPLLNELLAGLTHVDYQKRPTLARAQQRLNSAKAVLRNERAYQVRLAHVREMRRRRLEALKLREQRLFQAQLRLEGIDKC